MEDTITVMESMYQKNHDEIMSTIFCSPLKTILIIHIKYTLTAFHLTPGMKEVKKWR